MKLSIVSFMVVIAWFQTTDALNCYSCLNCPSPSISDGLTCASGSDGTCMKTYTPSGILILKSVITTMNLAIKLNHF